MPRLLNWPSGLVPSAQEPLSGPSSVSAGGQSSVTGFQQTVSSPFGLWIWSMDFHPMRDRQFREFRGWMAALQNGANATRWSIHDPDRMSFRDSGVDTPQRANSALPRVNWSNNLPWSNGIGWTVGRPWVQVGSALPKGATTMQLPDVLWGRKLGMGEMFGFAPLHFGLYIVTRADLDGVVQFWPPLRTAVLPTSFATLDPTIVVRLVPGSAGGLKRDVEVARGMSATFIEVEHEDVARFYA